MKKSPLVLSQANLSEVGESIALYVCGRPGYETRGQLVASVARVLGTRSLAREFVRLFFLHAGRRSGFGFACRELVKSGKAVLS
jgi:hypothetical protein